ncbi:MAG TPA: hypothetical protein VLA19_27970, partial [Herpetosiphonaceae bacterium]|nr:hypothetical protein [Herpetosiphonaceae bacterium]
DGGPGRGGHGVGRGHLPVPPALAHRYNDRARCLILDAHNGYWAEALIAIKEGGHLPVKMTGRALTAPRF